MPLKTNISKPKTYGFLSFLAFLCMGMAWSAIVVAKPLPEATPKLEVTPPKKERFVRPRHTPRARMNTTTVRITHTMSVPTAPDPGTNSDLQQEIRQKIYEKIKGECAILEAAFERACKIKNINMSNNSYSRNRSINRVSATVVYELAPAKKDSEKADGERDL